MWYRASRVAVVWLFAVPVGLVSAAAAGAAIERLPEEVVITGSGDLIQLRKQMLDAERRAYDVFNRFNDEERFRISCDMHQPTGTRFKRQVCAPEFQIRATSSHAAMVLETFSKNRENELLKPGGGQPSPIEGFPAPIVPMEAVIAAQQEAYKRKLREIAEQHPEFLQALIEYTQLREDYSTATGRSPR